MSARIQAIFDRQIKGDNALFALAQKRFAAAGLAAEFYPTSPEQLAADWQFNPAADRRATVHMPRDLAVLNRACHPRILAFAATHPDHISALVLHDQPEVATRFDEYVAAARDLDRALQAHGPGPRVHIEYAAGLEPEVFIRLFQAIRDCPRLSATIDISHIGIRQCQVWFARRHQREVCHLKPTHPDLPAQVEQVQECVRSALPVACEIIREVGALGKPLHFHLHDGHPSSPYSSFGVSDHLSFFQEVAIPFSWRGSRSLPPLYGPLGLHEIIRTARAVLPLDMLSLTLEVHSFPQATLDLGDHAGLFSHWRDRSNAERMNHWLEVLLRNHRLLKQCLAA